MIKKIDHLGIAVKSIEAASGFYMNVLGLTPSEIEEVPSQKVRTVFFECGEVHIELLEATDPESPIAKFIEKNGEGVHHVAYAVDSVQGQLERAKNNGARLINETPVPGAGGKDVGFVHPKSSFGVLTEFCASQITKQTKEGHGCCCSCK